MRKIAISDIYTVDNAYNEQRFFGYNKNMVKEHAVNSLILDIKNLFLGYL